MHTAPHLTIDLVGGGDVAYNLSFIFYRLIKHHSNKNHFATGKQH